ncbi:thioesterase family protein [Reyranella sp.]|uniref:thioesterase family protein n=1 Tax=Reyranella sp. TaxID=1929291 RepID=UPI003BA8661B
MEAIYRIEGATAQTSAFAGGPWDRGLQHGAAPSSLICWAIERLPAPVPMRVARLTVDLMRPVPVAPLSIETEVLREGRKIQLVSIRLRAGNHEVVRATALRVRRLEQVLPVEAPWPPIDIRSPEDSPDPTETGLSHTPFLSGLEMRVAKGSFRTPGPAAIWYRAARPIVEGAPLSPLMRAAIAADFCNGTSAVLDFAHWTFINGDLTLSLAREPVGEWILLDAETWAGPDSIGIAAARLADRDGYFGRAVQSVLFEKR